MAKIIIYTSNTCPYCRLAKELLSTHDVDFEEVRVDLDESKREEMIRLSQRRTVPQVFIDGQPVGGYDDLVGLQKSGKLNQLLKNHS